MTAKLFKHPIFLIGFIFIVGVLGVSVYYSLFVEPPEPPKDKLLYDEAGNLLAQTPFPPSNQYPLGSDREGISMVYKLIQGAKYTIGFAILISIVRMILSMFFGVLFASFLKRVRPVIKSVVDSFTFAPAAIIVYITLVSVVVVYSWAFSETEKLLFTLLSVTFIAVPTSPL